MKSVCTRTHTRTFARNSNHERRVVRNNVEIKITFHSNARWANILRSQNLFELSHVTSVAISVIGVIIHKPIPFDRCVSSNKEDIFFPDKYTFAFIAERGGCRGSWGIVEQRRGIVPNREVSVSISPCGYIAFESELA